MRLIDLFRSEQNALLTPRRGVNQEQCSGSMEVNFMIVSATDGRQVVEAVYDWKQKNGIFKLNFFLRSKQ